MKNLAKVGVNWKKKLEKVNSIDRISCFDFSFALSLADAEKLEYESDGGGGGKKKVGGVASKKRSPVQSKKRPANSPPPTNGKKKKR